MNDIQELYSLDAEEEGVKLPVGPPASKKPTGWIRIRGAGSQACRDARTRVRRRRLRETSRLRTEDAPPHEIEEAEDRIAREGELEVIASLVIDWSFDTPCTPEAIKELLLKAPKIADRIDIVSGEESLFFAFKRSESNDTSAPTSNSLAESMEQKAT